MIKISSEERNYANPGIGSYSGSGGRPDDGDAAGETNWIGSSWASRDQLLEGRGMNLLDNPTKKNQTFNYPTKTNQTYRN